MLDRPSINLLHLRPCLCRASTPDLSRTTLPQTSLLTPLTAPSILKSRTKKSWQKRGRAHHWIFFSMLLVKPVRHQMVPVLPDYVPNLVVQHQDHLLCEMVTLISLSSLTASMSPDPRLLHPSLNAWPRPKLPSQPQKAVSPSPTKNVWQKQLL